MEANVLPFALISLLGSLVYVAVVLALHVLPAEERNDIPGAARLVMPARHNLIACR